MAIEYTSELRAKDADVARAMGWRQISPPDSTCAWRPPGSSERVLLPRFHESHEARKELLEWLAADLPRWKAFLEEFWKLRKGQLEWAIDIENDHYATAAMYMLATPAQVAEAAWQAIQEGKKNDR